MRLELRGAFRRARIVVYAVAATAAAVLVEAAEPLLPESTGVEAVMKVFATSPIHQTPLSPLTQQPTSSRVRPLQKSTFEPLRKYFSTEQQRNVDQFLQALTDLANARNRRAELVGVRGHSWWPPTVDDLKVAAVTSQDLLCDRYEPPEQFTVSSPRRSNGQLKVTVHEAFTEYGQDRVLGKGQKTSVVILIPENGKWVIDEVVSTVNDSSGTRVEKLTELLRDAIKPLREAQIEISSLPAPEVRKAIKSRE
jgi:hypothetical protein